MNYGTIQKLQPREMKYTTCLKRMCKAKRVLFPLLMGATFFCHGSPLYAETLFIQVNGMSPKRWGYKSLSYGYFIELNKKEKTFSCNLPYHGVIHQPVQESGGIRLMNIFIEEFRIRKDRKNRDILSFCCNSRSIRYFFRLEQLPNGNVIIRLEPSHGDSIEYNGNISNGK